MADVDMGFLGARLDELLKLTRGHGDRLVALDKWQRRIDMQLEGLTDEIKVQGAMLVRLEHAVGRLGDRLTQWEEAR